MVCNNLKAEAPRSYPVSTRRGRWDFLDAARGIAAFLVVVEHSAESDPLFHKVFFHYFNLGEIGVVTFFLISGFIIPAGIERSGSQTEFWLGRAFRLLPALWVNFAVVLALGVVMGSLDPTLFTHTFRYIVGNLAMIPELLRVPCGEGAYWTLQYELVFYVFTAALFAVGLLRRSALWAWATCCLYLATNTAFALVFHHAFSAEKCGLVVTASIGTLIYRYAKRDERASALWVALALMSVAVTASNWMRLGIYSSFQFQSMISPLCADISFLLGYLLFGAFFVYRGHQFPAPLLWLGRISYSVYLWHAFVLLIIPSTVRPLWRILLVVAVTLPLAAISYRYVEAPVQKLARKFSKPMARRLERKEHLHAA
jgi:peptidoglycan/LPS O-acetylase OafA/YrhL